MALCYYVPIVNNYRGKIMSPELKMHIRDKKRKEEARKAMQTLIDATNIMGGEKEVAAGILEGLLGSHRTLQQSFFRSFVMAMEHYADTPFHDARNDASVEFAQLLRELVEHNNLHFPFI